MHSSKNRVLSLNFLLTFQPSLADDALPQLELLLGGLGGRGEFPCDVVEGQARRSQKAVVVNLIGRVNKAA